ncbi:MAG: DNA replication/repair protein RecF [Bacteroidetes bacterium]|nr:DNA replication/repair protein RecF [Bacteroidota bacterium]MCW5894594.1 DNA replication/repair protein RecF [Bacteroidota bacterium]
MNVEFVHLKNFRNHEDTVIECGAGINALLGNNGQGKTNVLEAISYLSLTKSFYAAGDATVLQIGKDSFEIDGKIQTDAHIEHRIHAAYNRSGDKSFTINGARPETFASVIGRFPIVVLSPENNAITFGGPMERRKFIDLLLSQISRSYLEDLLEYRRILKQRNRLLTEAKAEHRYPAGLLEPWTASLIHHGARIINNRKAFVREFREYVKRAYYSLVSSPDHPYDGNEDPSLHYESLPGLENLTGIDPIMEVMRDELERKNVEERRRGSTLVGPHRDDLRLRINDISVQQYASQGQHKTLLLSLKIAEFFYLKEHRGEVPVFLLDDVFSELDETRSQLLLNTLSSLGQTFITTTEEGVFHDAISWNRTNRRFRVEAGSVRPA